MYLVNKRIEKIITNDSKLLMVSILKRRRCVIFSLFILELKYGMNVRVCVYVVVVYINIPISIIYILYW